MVTEPLGRYIPVFSIARAADLAEMHPQTLRQYDRIGLVAPQRTSGNVRRYSLHDVEQLREVQRLSSEGLSLEGIRRVLQLENQVRALRHRVRELEQALAETTVSGSGARVFAAGAAGEVVSVRRGARTRSRNEVVIWQPYHPRK